MTMWDFAAAAGSDDLVEADRASILATAVLGRPTPLGRDAVFGPPVDRDIAANMPGIGLLAGKRAVSVVALGDASYLGLAPGSISPIRPTALLDLAVGALGGTPDWLDDVVVLAITPPERHATGGDIRSIEDIPARELATALRSCASGDREGEASRAFGLRCLSASARERLRRAIPPDGHMAGRTSKRDLCNGGGKKRSGIKAF